MIDYVVQGRSTGKTVYAHAADSATLAQAGNVDLDGTGTIAGVNALAVLLPYQGVNPASALA